MIEWTSIEERDNEMKEIGAEDAVANYFLYFEHENYAKCDSDKEHFDEITTDLIKEVFIHYMHCPTLDDAEKYINDVADTLVKDTSDEINWDLPNYKETPAYVQWHKHSDIQARLYRMAQYLHFPEGWVYYNGKKRTLDEACELAANSWMNLIFKWHLNDNGALNEEHSFFASALSSSIGNDIKEKISEDVKKKAFELFKGFYKAYILNDVNWLLENIPSDNPEKFNWKCICEPDCDYDPSWSLYLILFNAGVAKDDIKWICPWKTSIKVRPVDNAVIIGGYQKRTVL